MRYAMIMAGGSGTRLWPLSRKDRPKQLLPLMPDGSLLSMTVARLDGVVAPEHRYVCTGERFRSLLLDELPLQDEQILGEPEGRDTVNAVALTAAVLAKDDPDAIFAVLTSDHLIQPQNEFRDKLSLGMDLVEQDPSRFVTFAIRPAFPATQYGYVERGQPITGHDGAFVAKTFVEKPDLPTAERYLQTGSFGWNSGMFVFGAKAFLECYQRHLPDSHEAMMEIARAWRTSEQVSVLNDIYPTLKKISVDFAIMEPAMNDPSIEVCVVDMDVTWLDVGSWPSFAEALDADANGNRGTAATVHLDSTNMLCVSDDPQHVITTIGCEDLIVIHTKSATMVCPASEAQRVKDMAGLVEERLR